MSHFRRGAGYSSGNYGALGANTGEPRGAGAGVSDSGLPIPNLPGNRAYNPREWQRPKTQALRVEAGVTGLFPGQEAAVTSSETARAAPTQRAQQTRPSTNKPAHLQSGGYTKTFPSWVAYDRMVMRFYGFFQESVPEYYAEVARLRKCTVLFYLEDGTLQITEPKEDNSGIPQGSFLRRHRAEKEGEPGAYIELRDLGVGRELLVYGRSFYLYACDGATRSFMEREGYELAPDEEPPEDEYHKAMKAKEAAKTQAREHRATTRKAVKENDFRWLFMDKQVLRFYCSWDDRRSLYGDKLPFILHYFLADDTVEVLEVPVKNSGRDPYPMLVKRGRLPKYLYSIGAKPLSAGQREAANLQYYHWEELGLGKTVFVYGRHMKMFDCDEFTRNWYKVKKGINMQPDEAQFEKPKKRPEPVIPPDQLRIGREEDTRRNCLSLMPKPPQPNWQQFINCSGQVMRFFAWFVEDPAAGVLLGHESDRMRRFIVSYFLVDDSVGIFEPPQRNSGIVGGKYLERGILRKPGSRTVKYLARDFFEGARITAYGRILELGQPDLFTQNYQEARSDLFPHADFSVVAARLSEEIAERSLQEQLRTVLIEADADGSGRLAKHHLVSALNHLGLAFTPAEATTLARGLDRDGDSVPCAELLVELGCGEEGQAPRHGAADSEDSSNYQFRPRRSTDAVDELRAAPPAEKVNNWMDHLKVSSGGGVMLDDDEPFEFQERMVLQDHEDEESAPVHVGFAHLPGLRPDGPPSVGSSRRSSRPGSQGSRNQSRHTLW